MTNQETTDISMPQDEIDFGSLMRIPPCLRRAKNSNGDYIATGEIKKGYEWVFDDESVICCEHIHGVNLCVVMSGEEGIWKFDFALSRSALLLGLSNHRLTQQVWKSMRRGLINKTQILVSSDTTGFIPGVIPYSKQIDVLRADLLENKSVPWFIPRKHQINKMRYSQWRKAPPTVENVSTWLREDLVSHLPFNFAQYIRCGNSTVSGGVRPSGLLFIRPSDGAMARINCDCFQWYYDESLKPIKKENLEKKITMDSWFAMTNEQREEYQKKVRKERNRDTV